jgi:flagellar hook-associated protein 2
MGRIQTDVGLNTGINITDTVTKLMQLASRPRDLLKQRTTLIQTKQAAVSELSGLLLAVQLIGKNLAKTDLYNTKQATSSDSNALAATITGDASSGSYVFTPLRMAQNQQLISSMFSSDADPIGAGTLSFRFGSNVERGVNLDMLNGGMGMVRGSIRITDRGGQSAVIDLSAAQTIDDVLGAINGNMDINVTAVVQGDHIQLIDNTGQAASDLKVQEVGRGGTAASLGLAGIDLGGAAGNHVANGQDIWGLYSKLNLGELHDGNGIRIDTVLPDIDYQLSNGETGTIDLSPIISGSSKVDKELTLEDIIRRFNTDSGGKIKLEIAADGTHLIANDMSGGSANPFTLTPKNQSQALADLGLAGEAVGNVITGEQIIGGLKSVMLSSLGGGSGLGTLGSLSLTDRGGGHALVDLSGAQTLDDVIQTINAAGIGIHAQVNSARNGLELIDTTGSELGPMIVADDGTTETATNLHIGVNDNVTSVNSGDLHLQVVSLNTRLADLNGGAGVAKGTLTIQDTTGTQAVLDLRGSDITTLGDVVKAIDLLSLQVRAEINATGDGIRLVDTAHGASPLKVIAGTGTTAADLHLNRDPASVDIGGVATPVIDGTTTYSIALSGTDTLTDLKNKINDIGSGVTAAIFSNGNNQYRLSLGSNQSGKAGELVMDGFNAPFTLQEMVQGQDALLAIGGTAGNAAFLISSSSNQFSDVLPGVGLEIKQPTGQPVKITVDNSDTNVVASVKTLVDNYNKFRSRLKELTAYDSNTDKSSTLTGDATALRLDTDLSYLLSGQYAGAGTIQSLVQLGIQLQDDGTLELDEDKLKAVYADEPDAVKQFFTQEGTGFSAKLDALIEQLGGEDHSLLSSRIDVLKDTIQRNNDRLEAMQKLLDAEQERLYNQFYQMDLAVGKMKSLSNILDQIQYIAPVYTYSNSSTGTSG